MTGQLLACELPPEAIFKTLAVMIVVRTVLEKLLSSWGVLLYDPVNYYGSLVGDLQMCFSWVVIFLSMSIPVALLLKLRYRDALKFTLAGFCITLSVPLVDYIATGGKGDEIRYFRNFDSFFYNYVQLFNPFAAARGVTLGVRLEVLTLFAGSLLVAWRGLGRSFLRSLFLALTLYTLVYVYGYLIPIHQLLGIGRPAAWGQETLPITGGQGLFYLYLLPLLLCLVGIVLVLRREGKETGWAILALLAPGRLLLMLVLLGGGFLYTALLAGTLPRIFNPFDLLKLLCAACSCLLLGIYAKLLEASDDPASDRSLPSQTPLAVGGREREEARGLATVFLACSAILAVPVAREFLYFWTFSAGLVYLYAAPPCRFRRFRALGSATLALSGLGLFLGGASISRPEDFQEIWKRKEVFGLVGLALYLFLRRTCLHEVEEHRETPCASRDDSGKERRRCQ